MKAWIIVFPTGVKSQGKNVIPIAVSIIAYVTGACKPWLVRHGFTDYYYCNRRAYMKPIFNRMLSGVLSLVMTASAIPIFSTHAEESTDPYPYTLFAASSDEGAITVNAGNFCVNGNVATNGTIVSSGNMSINGTKTESAEESMIFVFDKINNQYFSTPDIDEHNEDYILEETNININIPTKVQGEATLTGNININNALKALEDVNLYGEVKNTNDSVIFSKYGDIVIDSQNVNLNGLIYAPFGSVIITAQNLNLNNVVIIAESIVLNCPSVNVNNSSSIGTFVGNTSEEFFAPYNEWSYLNDTDSDGLPDLIEKTIGSDPTLFDTDGDNLPDGYEFLITLTDPMLKDSDGNGITDDAEDFDSDGLNNLEEYNHHTSPFNDDTDGDNLLDFNEIKDYFTNPLNVDTDDDGLNDDDEIKMGFNPNNPDSDNNGILDGDEIIEQEISKDVTSHDDTISEISVNMRTSGNLEKNLTIESVYNVDLLATDVVGLIGDPFKFEVTTSFESADITFTINQSKLNDTNFDDLCVLWYDEYNQRFIECTSENDFVTTLNEEESTITVTTKHFSKYMVVNKKEWYKVWDESLKNINSAITGNIINTTDIHFNTVFVIDTSGSMTGNFGYDPITRKLRDDAPPRPPISDANMEKYWLDNYGCYTCKRITACENFINNMKSSDRAAIITFSNISSTITQCNLTSSKTDLINSLQNLSDNGGTYYSKAIDMAIDILLKSGNTSNARTINRIIFLSDGESASDDTVATNQAVSKALKNRIKIYTFGLGRNSGDELLKNIANITKGDFFKVTYADELVDVISNSDIDNLKNNPDFDLLWKMDSDGDSIPDLIEIYGLRPNGKPLGTNKYDSDSDNDGLSDGEEIIIDKEKFEEGINNGNVQGGITTPTDPTKETIYAPYGQIKYKEEYYPIAVPALQYIRKEYYYEPVYEKYDSLTASDINFSLSDYITGRELAITDDLHDASQAIDGGYTFTKKNGYLKDDTFRNEKAYNIAAGGVLVFSMITDMISGSLSRKDIYFNFYKTGDNSARKVIITVCSSDVQQMYDKYSGYEHSGFIERAGYVYSQVMFSKACKELYEKITNSTADNSYYYDLVVNVDDRHRGSSAFANLWINDEGNIMATPILYDNDYVKLVRRKTWTYLFAYDTLLNMPLSETINLEQSYLELFKKAYEES